jgi:DNA-binding NarL/FixJ family response regulator
MSVLIVDDHGDFRRSSRALLEADGFRVGGEVAEGREAVELVQRLRPAVVQLDVMLPDLDGFAAAEAIAALDDPPVVVLVSSREASVYRARLSTTTARAFLAKSQLSGAALARLVA